MRKALSLLLVVGLAGSLAACSSGTSSSDSTSNPTSASSSGACDPVASGDVSDAVTVTGDYGTKPTVKFTAPLTTVEATQRTVVSTGDGAKIEPGETLSADFTLLNGTTGKELTATGYDSKTTQSFTDDEATFLPGLIKTINCSTIGSRVVGVIPPSDAWGEAGQTDLGVAATDSIVFVVDIVAKMATKATGTDVAPEDGFPTVTLADDGTPTLTIPDADPPTDLKIEVLKKGDGAVVADGDSVTVQYQGTNWTDKKVFDQSWGSAPATFATDAVVTGFGKAMVGQTVGSQVVVIIPPDEGYGAEGSSGAGISGTDTLVFVIDILATS